MIRLLYLYSYIHKVIIMLKTLGSNRAKRHTPVFQVNDSITINLWHRACLDTKPAQLQRFFKWKPSGFRSASIRATKHATREREEFRRVYLGVSHSSWLHVEKYKVQVSAIWTRLQHACNDSAVNQALSNHRWQHQVTFDLLKKDTI